MPVPLTAALTKTTPAVLMPVLSMRGRPRGLRAERNRLAPIWPVDSMSNQLIRVSKMG